MNHRVLWIKNFGSIPKDKNNRSYEIHHIDGNHTNNNITNLKLVTIEEHFKIHEEQKDWGACVLIAKRMNLPSDYLYRIQKGKRRPGIGGVKKGTIPWNKGKQNCFSEESIAKMSNTRKGRIFFSKFSKDMIENIRKDFTTHSTICGVGTKQKNGMILTQERAFSKLYSTKYHTTSNNLHNIITGVSWKK